jgi:cysteine-rich repeat protein
MRAVLLALLLVAAGERGAMALDATGIYTVSGLPGVSAISLRQIGTSLQMCVSTGGGAVHVAAGTIAPLTGAFTLSYVPSALGPGGLGAYCSITITGTVAADGSLTATQSEYSTCVPPPLSCVPSCTLSATIPFAGNRTSTTPAPCCGDTVIDAGEQCDDGNATSGDCCAADCTNEPAGSGTCPNVDLCMLGTCSGFGYCTYASSCTDEPLYGTKLVLKRTGSREKLIWLARDTHLNNPIQGTSADPSLVGATLELFAPFESRVAMTLPPGIGKPGWLLQTASSYRFRNPLAPLGISPVRVAVLKHGRLLKIVARDTGFPLDKPLAGVGIRLVAGDVAMCSYFHVGTVVADVPGYFEARDAGPFFGDCNAGILSAGSPSGAFVD